MRALLSALVEQFSIPILDQCAEDAKTSAAILVDALTSTNDHQMVEAIPLIQQGTDVLADSLLRLTTAADHINAYVSTV